MDAIVVAALYQFKAVACASELQQSLKELCKAQQIFFCLARSILLKKQGKSSEIKPRATGDFCGYR